MSVNLATKYEQKLANRFAGRSFTEGGCGTDYTFDGVNAIKIWTLVTDPLNDYTVGSGMQRFGQTTEVDDIEQTIPLTEKKSFSKTFDICNVQDQMFVKKATAYLQQMWDEQYVPTIDKYRLAMWAEGAGLGKVNATALTKATVLEEILKAHAEMDDALVPQENRITYVRSDVAVACKLAQELSASQNWVNEKIVKGKIAEINGSDVIAVPASRMPAGVEFMIKYKKASADAVKLKLLRANEDAPGVAGTLMEGLVRYVAHVIGAKADGVYVYAQSGMVATPTISISGGSATVNAASGTTVKYTLDGSDPKTSSSAAVYSAAVAVPAGATIKAYAAKAGSISSAVARATN